MFNKIVQNTKIYLKMSLNGTLFKWLIKNSEINYQEYVHVRIYHIFTYI